MSRHQKEKDQNLNLKSQNSCQECRGQAPEMNGESQLHKPVNSGVFGKCQWNTIIHHVTEVGLYLGAEETSYWMKMLTTCSEDMSLTLVPIR